MVRMESVGCGRNAFRLGVTKRRVTEHAVKWHKVWASALNVKTRFSYFYRSVFPPTVVYKVFCIFIAAGCVRCCRKIQAGWPSFDCAGWEGIWCRKLKRLGGQRAVPLGK